MTMLTIGDSAPSVLVERESRGPRTRHSFSCNGSLNQTGADRRCVRRNQVGKPVKRCCPAGFSVACIEECK
jgi:hypothetical protein